jgi:type IV secretory pathway VirJ component
MEAVMTRSHAQLIKTQRNWTVRAGVAVALALTLVLTAGPLSATAQPGDSLHSAGRSGNRVAGTVSGVDDLPLYQIPAAHGPLLAVLISGDGGWVGADKSLAAALARRNVAVVGLNAPRYLDRKPSPDQAAADLTRILRHFLPAWHRERVIVIGYSRGADIGPFMVSGLPADLRERIALAVLLGPGESASFRVGVLDVLRNHEGNPEYPVQPEIAKLRGIPILCIYGSKDTGAICPRLEQSGLARSVMRTGGHRVSGDEGPALADLILTPNANTQLSGNNQTGGGTK